MEAQERLIRWLLKHKVNISAVFNWIWRWKFLIAFIGTSFLFLYINSAPVQALVTTAINPIFLILKTFRSLWNEFLTNFTTLNMKRSGLSNSSPNILQENPQPNNPQPNSSNTNVVYEEEKKERHYFDEEENQIPNWQEGGNSPDRDNLFEDNLVRSKDKARVDNLWVNKFIREDRDGHVGAGAGAGTGFSVKVANNLDEASQQKQRCVTPKDFYKKYNPIKMAKGSGKAGAIGGLGGYMGEKTGKFIKGKKE